jgi:hypothetical protein
LKQTVWRKIIEIQYMHLFWLLTQLSLWDLPHWFMLCLLNIDWPSVNIPNLSRAIWKNDKQDKALITKNKS